jgi:hypothetical protein
MESADNFKRDACACGPCLWRDDRASRDCNTAADDGVLFERATRMRISRKEGAPSRGLMAVSELEALEATGLVSGVSIA